MHNVIAYVITTHNFHRQIWRMQLLFTLSNGAHAGIKPCNNPQPQASQHQGGTWRSQARQHRKCFSSGPRHPGHRLQMCAWTAGLLVTWVLSLMWQAHQR